MILQKERKKVRISTNQSDSTLSSTNRFINSSNIIFFDCNTLNFTLFNIFKEPRICYIASGDKVINGLYRCWRRLIILNYLISRKSRLCYQITSKSEFCNIKKKLFYRFIKLYVFQTNNYFFIYRFRILIKILVHIILN